MDVADPGTSGETGIFALRNRKMSQHVSLRIAQTADKEQLEPLENPLLAAITIDLSCSSPDT